jgi:hypothetical protein
MNERTASCRRVLAVAAVVLGIVVLAACGSSSATNATSMGSGSGSSTGAATDAFTECLKKQGIALPSGAAGGAPGGGFSGPPAGFTGASGAFSGPPAGFSGAPGGFSGASGIQACQSLAPQGSGAPGGGGQAFNAYASCMKDNGVDLGATAGGSPAPTVNTNDPKFIDANTKCAPLLPTASGATPTTKP